MAGKKTIRFIRVGLMFAAFAGAIFYGEGTPNTLEWLILATLFSQDDSLSFVEDTLKDIRRGS